MTNFNILPTAFSSNGLDDYKVTELWLDHWPVVYLINNKDDIYIGETSSTTRRLNQHLANPERAGLTDFNVIKSDKFNKSATLDLESFLINRFFADEKYNVTNRNRGIPQEDYFDKKFYNQLFNEVFEELKNRGFFNNSLTEIENKDLFKLSPFKSLTEDQAAAAIKILEKIIYFFRNNIQENLVVRGNPGTGKTVIAIFLVKFISDLASTEVLDNFQLSDDFITLCTEENISLLRKKTIGFVIPQKSLRTSVKKVFKKIPGLNSNMVLTPFEVGKSNQSYDLLIVDEAHRLGQRANQASGPLNKSFSEINLKLFNEDSTHYSQLDWIRAQSRVQLLLVDENQTVKPGDLPIDELKNLIGDASSKENLFKLHSQMRIKSADAYIDWIQDVLKGDIPESFDLGDYDLEFFDSIQMMQKKIYEKENLHSLSRLLAGYAWKWNKKESKNPEVKDIYIQNIGFKWNSQDTDWVTSANALNEVGSIHTIQGYDLNYAGVIIGKDLRMDPETNKIYFDRSNYFDIKGMENNVQKGKIYSDEEILIYIQNIYKVLLTRGILGTYVFICDNTLREFFKSQFENLMKYQNKNLNPDAVFGKNKFNAEFYGTSTGSEPRSNTRYKEDIPNS